MYHKNENKDVDWVATLVYTNTFSNVDTCVAINLNSLECTRVRFVRLWSSCASVSMSLACTHFKHSDQIIFVINTFKIVVTEENCTTAQKMWVVTLKYGYTFTLSAIRIFNTMHNQFYDSLCLSYMLFS